MGFSVRTNFLENEVLNFSRALVLINFWNEGGVLELVTPDFLVLGKKTLKVLEDLASILDLLGWDIWKKFTILEFEKWKRQEAYPTRDENGVKLWETPEMNARW